MQHLLALVQQLDEFSDAAGVDELGAFLGIGALIGENDFEAFVQEGSPSRMNQGRIYLGPWVFT